MRSTFAPLALAALAAANPLPQSSSSCSDTYDGTFEIQVVNGAPSKRDTALVMSLQGGVLTDSQGRTGYIASNSQFQFDSPPQAGALQTSGFAVCPDNSLAINGDSTWYKCLSGTFYNLYDSNDAGQCSPVTISVVKSGGSSFEPSSAPAPAPSSAPASTVVPAPSATAVASQIPDGQVTATTVPVTQISDGQIQAPTSVAAPVTQISDGQIQAPTSVPAPPVCSEYVDGQPQCVASTGAVPVYPSGTGAPVPSYTGPAIASGPAAMATPFAGLLAGALGVAALL